MSTCIRQKYCCIFEPTHDKTNKITFAQSEDLDQLGHPPSLISLCCTHEETLGPQLPIERTAKTPIRLGGCLADLSSLGEQVILLVFSLGGSFKEERRTE